MIGQRSQLVTQIEPRLCESREIHRKVATQVGVAGIEICKLPQYRAALFKRTYRPLHQAGVPKLHCYQSKDFRLIGSPLRI